MNPDYVECYVPDKTFTEDSGHKRAKGINDHGHKCPTCKTIWYHDNTNIGAKEAHTCPIVGCGDKNFFRI